MKTRHISWIIASYALLSITAFAQKIDLRRDDIHTLTWTQWDFVGDPTADQVRVTFDGKMLGNERTAVKLLDKIELTKGAIVRVILPPETKLDVKHWHSPVSSSGQFLRKWREAGVVVEFYLRGSMVEVHTLTWTDYLDASGNFKENLDESSVILDGENIGKAPTAIKKLLSYPWKAGSILQEIVPERWPPPMISGPRQFALDGWTPKSAHGEPIVVDQLRPPDVPEN
jgi:hypothetical protein